MLRSPTQRMLCEMSASVAARWGQKLSTPPSTVRVAERPRFWPHGCQYARPTLRLEHRRCCSRLAQLWFSFSPTASSGPSSTFASRAISCWPTAPTTHKAVAGFRWPDPVPFNWAIDWFDAELASAPTARTAAASGSSTWRAARETKLTFGELSHALQPGRQLAPPAGAEARRSSPAGAEQRGAAVGDHAGGHEARRRGDPGDDAAHHRGAGRPRRARPRAHDRHRRGPGRQVRRP